MRNFVIYRGADKSLARPEGNKLMCLSERREFPSAPCLAGGKKTWWWLASRCCWNRAHPWHASKLVSSLVGLRTNQHPGIHDTRYRYGSELSEPGTYFGWRWTNAYRILCWKPL